MKAIQVLKMIGAALAYLIVNVLISVLVVAVYAFFVNPGQAPEVYDEFAKYSAPFSSIFAGMPLMFFWAWLLRKWWSFGEVIGVWIVYVIIDLTVLTAAGWTTRLAVLSSASLITKLLAAVLGARFRERSVRAESY